MADGLAVVAVDLGVLGQLPPFLVFFVAAATVLLVPRRVGAAVTLAAPLVALAQILSYEAGQSGAVPFYGLELEWLRVDRLSLAFGYIFAGAAFLSGLYGLKTMDARERAAALTYAGSAAGAIFAGDLLAFFILWEVKAVASALLIARGIRPGATAAARRYLYVQLTGGTILLGGILLHWGGTGSLAFTAFEPTLATAAMLVGFLLTAAVPPLGPWLPDAYPEASVPGTVWLSAFTTKASVYALARGFPGWEVLIWLGVIMALWGVVYAVLENDIRRLLAYHIISQVGYMVAAVGIGTEAAINGATAHAFAHILYKGLLLMGAGAVLHATGKVLLTELGGLARKMRWVFVLYMIGAVSISSVPLFSGYVSKELVVDAAGAEGLTLAYTLLKIASVGTFLHTGLKLPWFTFFGPNRGPQPGPVPASMYAAMGIAAVVNFAIGVLPGAFYEIMPYAVDYEPYVLGKVVEKSALLVFTALGFWILIDKLGGESTVSVDTDWFYRVAPRRVAAAVGGAVSAPAVRPWRERLASVDVRASARRLPLARELPSGESPVFPTWMLGATMLGAAALVLLLALVTML